MDDGLSERKRRALLEHLNGCPSCAATLARYRRIEAVMRRLPDGAPSPQLRASLFAAIEGSRSRGTPGTLRSLVAAPPLGRALPVAGALVILLLIGAIGMSAFDTYSQPAPTSDLQAALADESDSPGSIPALTIMQSRPEIANASTRAPSQGNIQGLGSLEQALLQAAADGHVKAPLPGYLPPGMHLERLSVSTGDLLDEIAVIEIAYGARDGKRVLITRTVHRPQLARIGGQTPIIIGGREWWYEKHPPLPPDGHPTHVVFARQNDEMITLDAVLPLDELVRIAGSIKWAEEGR